MPGAGIVLGFPHRSFCLSFLIVLRLFALVRPVILMVRLLD